MVIQSFYRCPVYDIENNIKLEIYVFFMNIGISNWKKIVLFHSECENFDSCILRIQVKIID